MTMNRKKKKFTLEYPRLSTDEGLEGWFADRVVQDNDQFTFFWNKSPQEAEMTGRRENQFVRFRWNEEEDPDAYFELTITPHELTGDVALTVTDFAEPDEYDDAVQMWDNNIKALRRALGCRL